jgi:hypothetical protein
MAGQGVYLCWWNKESHLYRPVLPREVEEFGLQPLETITRKIGEICRLILFSTEIVLSRDGKFVAVDYVNDQPDLRPQSKARDGVPDRVLHRIVMDIVRWVHQSVQEDRTRD